MVRVDSDDAVKHAFQAAAQLRNAGFIAEISFVDKLPTGIKWLLDITGSSRFLFVTDLIADRKYEVIDVNEVIALLEREGGSKASPA